MGTVVCSGLCISFVICQLVFSIYVENVLLKWSFCFSLGFFKMENFKFLMVKYLPLRLCVV